MSYSGFKATIAKCDKCQCGYVSVNWAHAKCIRCGGDIVSIVAGDPYPRSVLAAGPMKKAPAGA